MSCHFDPESVSEDGTMKLKDKDGNYRDIKVRLLDDHITSLLSIRKAPMISRLEIGQILKIINNVTVSSLLIKEFIVDELIASPFFQELVKRFPDIKSIIDDYNKKSIVAQNIEILDTIEELLVKIEAIKEKDISKLEALDESSKKEIIKFCRVFLEFFNKDFMIIVRIAGATGLFRNGFHKTASDLLKIETIFSSWPEIEKTINEIYNSMNEELIKKESKERLVNRYKLLEVLNDSKEKYFIVLEKQHKTEAMQNIEVVIFPFSVATGTNQDLLQVLHPFIR